MPYVHLEMRISCHRFWINEKTLCKQMGSVDRPVYKNYNELCMQSLSFILGTLGKYRGANFFFIGAEPPSSLPSVSTAPLSNSTSHTDWLIEDTIMYVDSRQLNNQQRVMTNKRRNIDGAVKILAKEEISSDPSERVHWNTLLWENWNLLHLHGTYSTWRIVVRHITHRTKIMLPGPHVETVTPYHPLRLQYCINMEILVKP